MACLMDDDLAMDGDLVNYCITTWSPRESRRRSPSRASASRPRCCAACRGAGAECRGYNLGVQGCGVSGCGVS